MEAASFDVRLVDRVIEHRLKMEALPNALAIPSERTLLLLLHTMSCAVCAVCACVRVCVCCV